MSRPILPWICSRCLTKVRKGFNGRSLRFQSSASAAAISPEPVYPALLNRARANAAEHETLSKQLNENYDVGLAKRVGELASIVDALKRWNRANESLSELQKFIRDHSSDEELRELAEEDLQSTVVQLNEASRSLVNSLIPKHPLSESPCLIEIRPGAGGSEAAIFAGNLLEMYQAFCAERGLRAVIMKKESVDEVNALEGVLEAILAVETPGAYGMLRCEAGVHRVQRVPATERTGRIHTSAASVMVLPLLPDEEATDVNFNDPSSDYYVDPKDVRIDVMRSGGPGGQHVNKTESKVRLQHLPTNTVIEVEENRSQLKNREAAWTILRSRLAEGRREAREEEMLKLRRSIVGVARIGRGDKIRTYNYLQQRITDHRSGLTVHGIEGVMQGGQNLEKLMESVRNWLAEREVEDMLAAEKSKR